MSEKWEELFDEIVADVAEIWFGIDGTTRNVQNVVRAALRGKYVDQKIREAMGGMLPSGVCTS